MRCPDCNKFATMEDGEPEIQDENPDLSGTSAETEVRFTRVCQDCGTELQETYFTVQQNFGQELIDQHIGDGHELSVEVTNAQVGEEHVPPNSTRYKTIFFVDVDFNLSCSCKEGEVLETQTTQSEKTAISEFDRV